MTGPRGKDGRHRTAKPREGGDTPLKPGREPMLRIETGKNIQTVIATYDVAPGSFEALLARLKDAYEQFLSRQPGFIAAAIHVNDARTRIANYSQWRSRDDFQAVLRNVEMQDWNRQFSELCRSFAPIMYDVLEVHDHQP